MDENQNCTFLRSESFEFGNETELLPTEKQLNKGIKSLKDNLKKEKKLQQIHNQLVRTL